MKNQFQEARELYKNNKFEEVCEWLESHIAKHPQDAQAYLFLATVLFGMAKVDESIAAEKKALELDPNCREEYDKFRLTDEPYNLSSEEEMVLRDALGLGNEKTSK